MSLLALLSLNIERSKHLERVAPFLSARKADVACIQELCEKDIPLLSHAFGAPCIFTPMARYTEGGTSEVIGVGIFSRLPVIQHSVQWYRGDPSTLPEIQHGVEPTFNSKNLPVVSCDVEKEGECFRIATTHFTWTPDGKPTGMQREDMKQLLAALGTLGEFVLTGDFNAPRGGEIFGMLAEKYTDNVPARYTTSIDGSLHRNGALELMVDGLFSTPAYEVSAVEMVSGVSDHCALVGSVSKRA